jgi:hypothetical protein
VFAECFRILFHVGKCPAREFFFVIAL